MLKIGIYLLLVLFIFINIGFYVNKIEIYFIIQLSTNPISGSILQSPVK